MQGIARIKAGACRAGGAWLNYYIKSIRRLGRGPEIAADLGEKSGMTGSCERDACGSARPKVDTVWSFAAYRPDRIESRTARQGISSTDKDVTEGTPTAVTARGFSSSSVSFEVATFDPGASPTTGDRSSAGTVALVDGRYGRGLDSDAVSVKLPTGKQDVSAACEADLDCRSPEIFRSKRFAAPSGRCRGEDHAIVIRIKEVLSPVRH